MRSRVLALTTSLALLAAATTALAVGPANKKPWERQPWEGQPPYGLPMMTELERKTYWSQLQNLPTVEEKEAYWQAHIEKMKQRALERGVELPPPPRRIIPDELQPRHPRPPYFPDIMTDEEIRVYEETLMGLQDLDERKAFIAQNLKKMQERALARGVSMPATGAYADVLPYLDGADVTEVEEDTAEQDQAAAGKDAESDGESAALDDEEDE
jgi:hypothetical protein